MDPAEAGLGQAVLQVEVIHCAARGEVDSCRLILPDGATVHDAVSASGLLQRHPGLDPADAGIWGRATTAAQRLRDGDRVELYRPLLIEPMDARRERHKHQRQTRVKAPRSSTPG